ncbi:hypothetical protein ACFT25_34855 [Streptomyces hydrogenans]|uniref:hypothetical protein n=1 Tax=Streptomyces hydrogenans TaxID=1873719 RepID=UPI003629FC44
MDHLRVLAAVRGGIAWGTAGSGRSGRPLRPPRVGSGPALPSPHRDPKGRPLHRGTADGGEPRARRPYRLIARLGAGGTGLVHPGRSDPGRTVAVKVVQAEHAQHAEFRRRFAREVLEVGAAAVLSSMGCP